MRLLDETPRTELAALSSEIALPIPGEDHHRQGAGEQPQYLHTVKNGHGEVQQKHIGAKRLNVLYGLATVGSLGDDNEALVAVDGATQQRTECLGVVGDDHSQHVHGRAIPSGESSAVPGCSGGASSRIGVITVVSAAGAPLSSMLS